MAEKTKLQMEFESQTPSIARSSWITSKEYLQTYCTWLELQVEKREAKLPTRHAVKVCLENMYMFGGMPKPDPKYDSYLETMIKIIMGDLNLH